MTTGAGPGGSPAEGKRFVRGNVALLLAAFGTVPLLLGTVFWWGTLAILPTVGVTFLIAGWIAPRAIRAPWLLPALFGGALALGVLSVLTGFLNGLSDEPYATPAFAHAGLALYTRPVSFDYANYGHPHHLFTYYVYLPLLTYAQVPGLDYRWISLAAWAGSVAWLGRDPYASAAVGMPWIALLAANGQNDFVPLLALSLALAPRHWRGAYVAEVFALALKQLANVVVFFYHVFRKEWTRALLAIVVTLAFLAPFLLTNAGAVYCRVALADPGGGCTSASASFLLLKRNYWLYPTWALAVFHAPVASALRRLRGRWRGRG
ncbi:MAG: hypothetical protein L3K13_03775 [Thermoplasmata archaeon]|nr:hypothetical protein [Thermoplasmata archaeon]